MMVGGGRWVVGTGYRLPVTGGGGGGFELEIRFNTLIIQNTCVFVVLASSTKDLDGCIDFYVDAKRKAGIAVVTSIYDE